jgi:hypothetical protein
MVFTEEEVRVLGVLIEKQMTTPEYYPMTPNAIKNACNQKTNRNPVVQYDDEVVLDTLQQLRKKSMLTLVSGAGSRVHKYEHRMREVFFLNQKEMAVLCILMLRGPQTLGEIRSRTERMATFDSIEEVEEVVRDLSQETRKPYPLVVQLPVFPGQKEPRFMHLLSGEPDLEKWQNSSMLQALPTEPASSRIGELEERIEQLEAELKTLREQFQEFQKQFE